MGGASASICWIRIDVALSSPLVAVDSNDRRFDGSVLGAVMEFGVTAAGIAESRSAVESWVSSSCQFEGLAYRIVFDYVGEIEPGDVQREIYADEDIARSLLGDPALPGIWYRSGVGWYSEE